jgi:hypothetical protein
VAPCGRWRDAFDHGLHEPTSGVAALYRAVIADNIERPACRAMT